nr:unnamed protein product [Spirometra erinaceieuropaei]
MEATPPLNTEIGAVVSTRFNFGTVIFVTVAFDSVHLESLWLIMALDSVPAKIIAMVKAYYRTTTARVLVRNNLSQPFGIRSGVRQGCILSPILFIYAIDWILGRAPHKGDGVEFAPGHRLTDLDYADDIALLATSFGDLQSIVSRVNEVANSALRMKDERNLEEFDHHCLRTILRVKFTDFVSNETVHARCDNIARITKAIQERRLRWFGHVLRRPTQELSVTALDLAPLPHWRRRIGGKLKIRLDTVRQDMEVVLGPSPLGIRRWRRGWVELSTSAAADLHAWSGTVLDIIEAG